MTLITKEAKSAESQHKSKIARIYIIFISVFACVTLINIYSYFTIINMNKMATSLSGATLNLKLEATNTNLLFREIMSGVSKKDMNAVWKVMDRANGYADLITELDQDSRIPKQLRKYKDIILKCWQNRESANADQQKALLTKYNQTFTKLIKEIDYVESDLSALIAGKMSVFKILYGALIINLIALFVFIAITFYNYSKERKSTEKSLSSARDSLKFLLNTIDSILISVNAENIVTQWNKAAEKYTKIKADDAIGFSLIELLPFLSQYKTAITKVYHSHNPVELYRERIILEKERVFDISMNYTMALDCVVLQIKDETEHEMKDEQLRQSQKMRVVSNLIGSLANNFNNVLGAITGTISMIKYSLQNADDPLEDIKTNIDVIESSAQKAEIMVEQLLGLAKDEPPELKPLDLNDTIRHLMQICENTIDKSIELNAELFSIEAVVNADPKQIEQVLLELCDNASQAIQALDDPGARDITVSLDRVCPDNQFRATQPLAVKDAYWSISIADTGMGMSKEIIHRMFEPFYSTKENATGLGLAVVRDIITLHDGFIEVRSQELEGTIITIYIPECIAEEQTAQKDVAIDTNEQIPLGNGLILVVDDEEVMRRTASNILEKLGYTVITANDGEEAVDIFREKQDQIALALLDYSMPKMSGRDAFLAMKEINPNVKAVLVSGFNDDRITNTLTVGVGGFIKKPYSMQGLAQEVKRALE